LQIEIFLLDFTILIHRIALKLYLKIQLSSIEKKKHLLK